MHSDTDEGTGGRQLEVAQESQATGGDFYIHQTGHRASREQEGAGGEKRRMRKREYVVSV